MHIVQTENGQYSRLVRLHNPGTIQEVCAIVKDATKNGKQIRVVGSGHAGKSSFADSGQIQICTTNLAKVIKVSKSKMSVYVEGGVSQIELVAELKRHNLCTANTFFPCPFDILSLYASCYHFAVVSGDTSTRACDVLSMKVVTRDGSIQTLTKGSKEFNFMLGSSGLFGILVGVEIEVQQNRAILSKTTFASDLDFNKFRDGTTQLKIYGSSKATDSVFVQEYSRLESQKWNYVALPFFINIMVIYALIYITNSARWLAVIVKNILTLLRYAFFPVISISSATPVWEGRDTAFKKMWRGISYYVDMKDVKKAVRIVDNVCHKYASDTELVVLCQFGVFEKSTVSPFYCAFEQDKLYVDVICPNALSNPADMSKLLSELTHSLRNVKYNTPGHYQYHDVIPASNMTPRCFPDHCDSIIKEIRRTNSECFLNDHWRRCLLSST